MKQIFIWLLGVLVPVLGLAQEQMSPEEKAKVILDKVKEKYKSYNTIEVDFNFILENRKKEEFKEVREGEAKLKGKKFRINIGNHLIICDNKNVWTYMKNVKEVQINNYEPDKMKINPSEMFTIYQKGYLYGYKGKVKQNGDYYYNIELTPENKDKSYYKIRLYVDPDSYRVMQTRVFEKDGSIYTYKFNNYKLNQNMPNSMFSFNKSEYPDVTVIDLRQ